MVKMADRNSASGTVLRRVVVIRNSRGLHARASAKFVKCAEKFDATISVSKDAQTVPGTSIMGLMMLAAVPGSELVLDANGTDAQAALDALEKLVEQKFDEKD